MQNVEKHDTSSVFIFNSSEGENKLLLVHHKKFDKWMIPGGHVESYENQYECALREVLEETGLTIQMIDLGSQDFEHTFPDATTYPLPFVILEEKIPVYKDKPEHYHLDFLYVGKSDTNSVQIADRESNDIRWFTEEEFHNLNLFESTRHYGSILFKQLNNL